MSQNPFHAAPGGQPDVIMDVEVAEPKMYQVLLHNDDYTTMEFGEGFAVLQRHPRRHPCGNRRPIFRCAGCPPLFRAFPMPFLAITCLYCQYYRMIECFNADWP